MEDIRWLQRFDNYKKALSHLAEIKDIDTEETPIIIKEGFIQRFEYTFELAWKTLKDYMEYQGLKFQPSPMKTVKEAFAAGIIKDGQTFIDMIESRNKTAHTYDEAVVERIFSEIKTDFYPALEKLRVYLEGQI
ncbi:MAG: nucleotidyltransferase substrate binding protein [Ruminococcus sp.]|jgi:nucleotidyltransferase substrate binding protein (TIGR01987 family)|nr:nucleotidyltransferase substrate binding protein [Ruminococcus sp.]